MSISASSALYDNGVACAAVIGAAEIKKIDLFSVPSSAAIRIILFERDEVSLKIGGRRTAKGTDKSENREVAH